MRSLFWDWAVDHRRAIAIAIFLVSAAMAWTPRIPVFMVWCCWGLGWVVLVFLVWVRRWRFFKRIDIPWWDVYSHSIGYGKITWHMMREAQNRRKEDRRREKELFDQLWEVTDDKKEQG